MIIMIMMIIIIFMNFMFIFMNIVKIVIKHLRYEKKIFFCIYKMYLISAKEYKNASVDFLKVRKTGETWASTKDSGRGLGVKNISDLV